jgi:beta-xylosidase
MRLSGNPVLGGWYADPEVHFFEDRFWIYPTTSAPYEEQTYFEAFSSADLTDWRPEGRVLDLGTVPWSTNRCAWAPTCAERHGTYYFYFSAGDGAGLGVATAKSPAGPFADAIGRPIVSEYHHGAQPIDAHAFLDTDGSAYLYWGGWKHCVAARLSDDMLSIQGEIVELTPERYVEGPFMLKREGTYYLMWSEGEWGNDSYQIAYARSQYPFGPFIREREVFVPSPQIATSAGHHSALHLPRTDRWIIAYHRRPLTETDRHHRVTCLEELHFEQDGSIRPVPLTDTGVESVDLRRSS